jgi:transcriptional regulator with XRE-family HTH domain
MLDVSRPTLVQIEAGNRNVKVEEIKKLSEIFDISTDYLL